MEINEFKIRPVTRYVVTHYHATENSVGCRVVAELDNEQLAQTVASALAASVPGGKVITHEDPLTCA